MLLTGKWGLPRIGPFLLLQKGWGVKLDFLELQKGEGGDERISVLWAFNKIYVKAPAEERLLK